MNILIMTETHAQPSRRLAPVAPLFQGRSVSVAGRKPVQPADLLGFTGTPGADERRLDLRTSMV